MNQKEAIERLHVFASENTVGCTDKDEQTQTWETYQKSLKGWAAETYLDLLAGNVRAIASSDIACEWTEADIIGEAIRITHATIEALEIEKS